MIRMWLRYETAAQTTRTISEVMRAINAVR